MGGVVGRGRRGSGPEDGVVGDSCPDPGLAGGGGPQGRDSGVLWKAPPLLGGRGVRGRGRKSSSVSRVSRAVSSLSAAWQYDGSRSVLGGWAEGLAGRARVFPTASWSW